MPSRVLESAPRVDEASASLRPANPRRWTSIELGHQPIIATPRKRLSTTTPPLTRAGSYFLPQPGASGIEARSPANKRAPASRSSHGIETANGPPPALSTQRSPQSYSTEDSWRYPASTDQLALRPQLTHRALQGLAAAGTTSRTNSSNSTIRLADVSFDRGTNLEASENTSYTQRDIRTERSDMSATTPWLNGQHSSEPDPDRTIRISDSTTVAGRGEEGKATREGAKARQLQEDLFLDLAHTDVSMQDVTDPAVRVDRRRPRISASDHRQPVPHAYQQPSTLPARPPSNDRAVASHEGPHMANGRSPQWHQLGQSEYTDLPTTSRQQPPRDRTYAASAHPLDHRTRSRVVSITPKATFKDAHGAPHSEVSPELDPAANRRRRLSTSEEVQTSARTYKQSNLSYSTTGLYNSSPLTGRSELVHGQESSPEAPQVEETESTASLTAPSTVWDELDDLKTRIRKLELTGKLPSSSGAAVTNATMANNVVERPHTATTTATTISSSPKGVRLGSLSPDKSVVEVLGVHPILRTALAKAQPFVKPSIYKALEATASDALTLAAMTGAEGSQVGLRGPGSLVAGSSSTVDRQLRRKADSMCRSLTELCIALSEGPSHTETSSAVGRPGSRNTIMSRHQRERSVEERAISRETSQEPEVRSGSRLMSRLEARRSSMMGLGSESSRRSPEVVLTPTPAAPATTGRLDRSSSIVHRHRSHDEEDDSTTRAPSRAMTEIRPSHHNRLSREYTSQHPLPSLHQRSPSVHSSLGVPKSYGAAAPATPATQLQPGHRTYLDRSAPSSADSARLAEVRQQRLASLEQRDTTGHQRARSFGTLGAITGHAQIEADPHSLLREVEFRQ